MKIAIIHDWLVTFGGAERALEQILKCYPSADVYCVVNFLEDEEANFLQNHKVYTSFIQKLPFSKILYRHFLPLMPLAIEQFDLSNYDIVVSSCHAVSKGVLTGPGQLHVSYTYSPCRYAWDLQHQYLQEVRRNFAGKLLSPLMRYFLHKFRLWDYRTSNSVDYFIVISKFIGDRVNKIYRRNSDVIYPPVNTTRFKLIENKDDYYVVVSRMVPYKKIPLIVEAFSYMPKKKLVVIGGGPDFARCKTLAGPNVKLLGYQPNEVVIEYMSKAKAFLFMAIEDFGIAPLEAQACGTPVIAYRGGALSETINDVSQDKPTGILFNEQTTTALVDAISNFEKNIDKFSPTMCANNAKNFSEEKFRKNFTDFIDLAWEKFNDD